MKSISYKNCRFHVGDRVSWKPPYDVSYRHNLHGTITAIVDGNTVEVSKDYGLGVKKVNISTIQKI